MFLSPHVIHCILRRINTNIAFSIVSSFPRIIIMSFSFVIRNATWPHIQGNMAHTIDEAIAHISTSNGEFVKNCYDGRPAIIRLCIYPPATRSEAIIIIQIYFMTLRILLSVDSPTGLIEIKGNKGEINGNELPNINCFPSNTGTNLSV